MLSNLIRESFLGTLYRCWEESCTLALLRRLWRLLCRLAAGSLLLQLAFGPSPGDRLWAESLIGRILHSLPAGVSRLLRPIRRAFAESAVGGSSLLRGSAVLHFDVLFGLFCCIMFAVPHKDWNNLYALIGAAVFFAVYLLLAAGDRRSLLPPDSLGLGPALFMLACVLSLLFSPDRADSFRVLLYYVTGFLLCWVVAASCRDLAGLRRLLGFLYLSLLLVSAEAIVQRLMGLVAVNASFTDTAINVGVPGRVYGSLDNPNNLSGFLQTILPLGAAFAGGTKREGKRFLLTLGLVLPVVALVMTYSRSGWLAMLLAALVYLFYCDKKLVPALVVLALLALPILPRSVLVRLSTIFNSHDSSRNHRLAIWQGVLALLGDKGYWLTGIGLGPNAFKEIYPEYAVAQGKMGAYHSQMLYLELDLELGLLGALSFLWMMLKLAGRIGRAIYRGGDRQLLKILIAAAASFAALAFSAAVEYVWFYPRCIFAFFLMLGVTLSALRLAERGPDPDTGDGAAPEGGAASER